MIESDQTQQRPKISKDDSIMVSSAMLPHRIRQRIVDKPAWYKSDDEFGWMTIDLSSPPNLLGFAQLCPDPSLNLSDSEKLKHKSVLDSLYMKLNDTTIDISDIIWSKWINERSHSDGFIDIHANEILSWRGVEPLKDGSYPTTYKMETGQHINILDNLWITVAKSPVIRQTKGKREKVYEEFVGKYLIKDSFIGERKDGDRKIYPYAWRVSPGSVVKPFLRDPNKQFMLMTKEVLTFHPINQLVEKRLSRHLIWQFRLRQAKGDYLRSFNNKTMLMAAAIRIERDRPGRSIDRMELAFDTLKERNIIRNWQYDKYFDEEVLRAKKISKIDNWLSLNVIFEPPKEIIDFNGRIINKRGLFESEEILEQKCEKSIHKLSEYQRTNNLSQLVLAEGLNIQPSYMSMLLRGKRRPSKSLIERIENLINQVPSKILRL